MKFWDASAVVPLVLAETGRSSLDDLYEAASMVVWWGTPVEVASAFARKEREGVLTPESATRSLELLGTLGERWREVPPSDALRRTAQRLLRVHALRAADSLQLAAALAVAGDDPGSMDFVCLDAKLAQAAAREGLRVATG